MADLTAMLTVSAIQWLPSLIITISLYIISSAIYNVYFHPLANIPGPFWCKISGWPSCYAAMTGYRHVWIWRNQQIYGDKFRYRPNGVMISSPKGYQDIYNSKANVKKAKWYEVWSKNEQDYNALNTTDKVLHAVKRKPLNQAFSEKSLRSAEPFVIKHVDSWIELLLDGETTKGTSNWASPKNLGGEWVDFLVFDILGDLCFGKDFDTKHPRDNPLREIPHVIGEYLRFMYPVANSPFLDNWVWLKPRGLDRLMAAITPRSITNYFEFLEECVTERKKQEESIVASEKDNGRKDMFHFLFNAKDPATNAPFSHPELLSSANLLVTAGSDTTSTALCSLFFYLSRNKRIYDKLANEIRQTFRTAEDICAGPELVECQYMHACILEGLRMTPSGPSELLREVLSGGYEIDDTWYPSGTLVGTPSYTVHYHQETFGDPFVFRPERWMADEERGSTAIEVAKLKEKFNPFSIGPGACPGKNLAMLEMKITLSRILYSNDFRRPPDDVLNRGGGQAKDGWLRNNSNHYQVIDAFLALRDGPMIQLRRRELL